MFRGFFNILKDLAYPKVCAACKKHLKGIASVDDLVCGECWKRINKNTPPFYRSCGRHLQRPVTTNICPACVRSKLHFDRAFSPCVYDGVMKDLIHAFKYRGKDHLGPTLGRLLAEFIEDYGLPMEIMDLIVPVPLHKTKLREREFNQAEALGSHIAGKFGKEMSAGALKRLRYTKTQTGLEPHDRLLNVRGSFAARGKELEGRNILLIDDVLTTGATCSEAALALKNAGAKIVFVLTLAN